MQPNLIKIALKMTNQKGLRTTFMTAIKSEGRRIKKLFALAVMVMATSVSAQAGGINTNTNMSVTFDRTLSRDAAIGIDGVYFNPAGVAFMSPGVHIAFNWQLITQKRYIDNIYYPLFNNNVNNPTDSRHFKGTALAPFFPSIQFAYNWRDFSFQAGAGVGGGGGKCTFDNGLGSFERLVSETALAASGLAQTLDASLASTLTSAGVPSSAVQALATRGFSSDNYFGSTGSYSENSFMRGRQYYYGVSFGVAYKLRPNLSIYGGARGVYASCNYYGYVRNIKVGNVPLYQVLDPTKENAADIELNTDQHGFGVTPIIGVDLKLGRWNLAAKYEFKTRMRLKNESVNQFPSIGNLTSNLNNSIVSILNNSLGSMISANLQQQHPTLSDKETQILAQAQIQEMATSALSSTSVQNVMNTLQTSFDNAINDATGEYQDGKKVAADLPAILTAGVGYTPIDQVRLNAGFHYYFDKQATSYNHREKKLDRGTIEYSFGAEYDPVKWLTVSAGYQRTSYGITDEYMDDKSFVCSSHSVGGGFMLHVTKKCRVNVAYFHTFYETKNTTTVSENTGLNYQADYTRNNNVFGASLEIDM